MSDTINKNRVFDENVVMFPSSKNYPPAVDAVDLGDDPLEALLNEFSDVLDDDLDNSLEAELEEIARERLEVQVENQNIRNLAQMNLDELTDTVKSQMDVLQETQKRISYLLKEIDSYMPGKR